MSGDALDALATRADGIGGDPEASAAPGAAAGPEPTAEDPNIGALSFLLAGFRELAGALLKVKSLQVTLDDGNVDKCARAIAPVATKYGINLGTMFDGPEAMALMVAGPILWTAAKQLDAELRAMKAKPVEPVPDDKPAGE